MPNPDDQQIAPPPVKRSPEQPPAESSEEEVGELSTAIRLLSAKPGEHFMLRDDLDRVLCLQRHHNDKWGWAYMGQYSAYNADVFPVLLQVNSHSRLGSVQLLVDGEQWNLLANGASNPDEYVFFSSNSWKGYPRPQFSARLYPHNADGERTYTLAWKHNGVTRYLRAAPGRWGWLTLAEAERNVFTLHKFYVHGAKLHSLISRTWPEANIYIEAADVNCEAISDGQAGSIWRNSGLPGMHYRPEAFDCDDYAFVYKGQAAKDAYAQGAHLGYAVGIVHGFNAQMGHAANIFVDFSGRLRLIEPQTGRISDAKDWDFTPKLVCF